MSSEGFHTDEDQSERKKDPQPDASRDGGDVQDALTAERIGSAVFNFYDTVSGSVGISGMGSPSPRRMTGVLNDAEIDDALRHFVQPAGWAAARADLVARHVVGLSGTPGSGRETTALALLREVTSGPVVVLSPVASLKELAERTYDRGRAYLVVDRIMGAIEQDRREIVIPRRYLPAVWLQALVPGVFARARTRVGPQAP